MEICVVSLIFRCCLKSLFKQLSKHFFSEVHEKHLISCNLDVPLKSNISLEKIDGHFLILIFVCKYFFKK